jgi:hypothetical protein
VTVEPYNFSVYNYPALVIVLGTIVIAIALLIRDDLASFFNEPRELTLDDGIVPSIGGILVISMLVFLSCCYFYGSQRFQHMLAHGF